MGLTLLVTGGAGYVGRFCVRHLLSAGHTVVVLDRVAADLETRATNALTFIQADLRETGAVRAVFRDHPVDAVLHLAAEKSVEHSMREPGPHLLNNVAGSLNLLEAMRAHEVRKIVFSSSAAVYGTPRELPVSEVAPLVPDNPYGASKVMTEEALRWYHRCHGFDSVSLRYFNAAGASDDGTMGESWDGATNLIPQVMRAAYRAGSPVPIFGSDFPTSDGTAVRDYVHVEDLAAAHLAALTYVIGQPGCHAFNLGRGVGASVREVLAVTEAVARRSVPTTLAPRRPGDPAAVYADVSAVAEEMGWRAQRDLEDIVRTAWHWHGRELEAMHE